MPDEYLVTGLTGNDDDAREPPVDWEVPEIAAIAILVAVGLLVLGGLATGIAASAGAPAAFGPGAEAVATGSAIQVGAVWAEPMLAIVLLGVLGVCWWHVDAWSGAVSDADRAEAAGHILRGRKIARWVSVALVLTLAGSVALFAGLLLTNSHSGNVPSLIWSRDIYEAASVLAVATIVLGGMWATTRLGPRFDGEPPRWPSEPLGGSAVMGQPECPRTCA